jgi:23S rRNA pseudoU1915 N3-methylase RlmH
VYYFDIKIILINYNKMGVNQSILKVNFEGMQNIVKNNTNGKFLIINTLDINNQSCLIKNTLSPEKEIEEISKYLKSDKSINIVIYGENSVDQNVLKKYEQLTKLGFSSVYLYIGGLLEWLLLQDYYSFDEFPTSTENMDLLKYKGKNIIA